jgi:hypothetical protein
LYSFFFCFKTVGYLQVTHQPLSRPKQIRAGEYADGRKIGLEGVKDKEKRWEQEKQDRKGLIRRYLFCWSLYPDC